MILCPKKENAIFKSAYLPQKTSTKKREIKRYTFQIVFFYYDQQRINKY
jgi:hypothetical protein